MNDIDERIRVAMKRLAEHDEVTAPARTNRALGMVGVGVSIFVLVCVALIWQQRGDGGDKGIVLTEDGAAPALLPPGPGWRRVGDGAPSEVVAAAVVGSAVIVWGSPPAIWRPGDGWSELPRPPLRADRAVVTALPGGLFVYDGGRAAVFETGPRRWRALADPPADAIGRLAFGAVWTGREVVVWGDRARNQPRAGALAWSSSSGRWRRVSPSPLAMNEGGYTWTGEEIVAVGANLGPSNDARSGAVAVAYRPSEDRWRRLPDPGLSPQSADVAWDGARLVAWDYELQARTLLPSEANWHELPAVPLRFQECYAESAVVGSLVFANYCDQAAVLEGRVWRSIGKPDLYVAVAGDHGRQVAVTYADSVLIVTGVGASGGIWAWTPP